MRSTRNLIVLIFLGALVGFACTMPSFMQTAVLETPTTQAVETNDNAPVDFATRTPIQDATIIIIPPTVTRTPQNTATRLPTETGTVTSTPIPCNWVQFVNDVSYPDGTKILIGETFEKTWRLKNIGSCSWNSGYRVVWAEGNSLSAPSNGVSVTDGIVSPGGFIDVSINLKAPSDAGIYQGYFRLKAPDGTTFGIGSNADSTFWAKIEALSPTSTPTITPGIAPDLYVSDFKLDPAAPIQGQPVSVSVSVYNGGNSKTDAFVVKWWGLDSFPNPSCTWIISSLVAKGGQVKTCTFTFKSWYSTGKTMVKVDTADVIQESNESNNTYITKISVKKKP